MWIAYAFGSALFAGLTSILAKCGIKQTDSNVATALRTIVVLVFSWLMVLVTGASWLCYYKALKDGLASVVVPIDKLSILVTIVFFYVVFHETLTRKALIGLLLIVGGTLLMLV